MIRVSVMYQMGEGKKFDAAYYMEKHLPMARGRLAGAGLVRVEIDKGVAGGAPGAPAPFAYLAHLYFNSVADFQQAMELHGKAVMGDIPNYTNIQPLIQISEIVG